MALNGYFGLYKEGGFKVLVKTCTSLNSYFSFNKKVGLRTH